MLSLVCKCVFYRPEHNAKGRPHGIEFKKSEIQKNEIYHRLELTE